MTIRTIWLILLRQLLNSTLLSHFHKATSFFFFFFIHYEYFQDITFIYFLTQPNQTMGLGGLLSQCFGGEKVS